MMDCELLITYRQLELTFHRELSLQLVQFILKHNTQNQIRKRPAKKLSLDLKRTQEVSQQDICTSQVLRRTQGNSKHQVISQGMQRAPPTGILQGQRRSQFHLSLVNLVFLTLSVILF